MTIRGLKSTTARDLLLLGVLLLGGAAHAVFYVFFIPPWYHHDEPSHLEYVLLVAKLGRIPEEIDRQQDVGYAIGLSMIESGFSSKMGGIPDLYPETGKVTQIGFSQLGGPPLYYLLAAVPIRFFGGEDLIFHLHLARMVSAIFYLLNIVAAWGLSGEIFSHRTANRKPQSGIPFMRVVLPAFLVLWPAHVDIMTAVNTDAPSIAFSGITLWGVARLIRVAYIGNRIPLGTLFGTLMAAAVALAFKETAVVVIPAVLVALLFALPRSWILGTEHPLNTFVRKGLSWTVIFVSVLVVFFLVIRNDDAAFWLRLTNQDTPLRIESSLATDGNHIAEVALHVERYPPWHVNLYQPVPLDRLPANYPSEFTLGVWMWADEPLETDLPTFSIGPNRFTRAVNLTTEPQFFAYTFTLQAISAPTVRISLRPAIVPDTNSSIYIDGLVLAEGQYSQTQYPKFADSLAGSGEWGGMRFTNLARNGSFERAGLRLAPWLDSSLAKFIPDQSLPSAWLQAALDWEGLSYYFEPTAAHLFRTFWARFAWGNLALVPDFPIIGAYPYRKIGYLCIGLIGLTIIMLVNRAISIYREPQRTDSSLPYPATLEILFIFSITIFLAWGITLLRGSLYTGTARLFYPVARYALPAVLPTLLMLLTGWSIVTEKLQESFDRSKLISIIIFLLAMIFLNALSLKSILTYLAG